MANKKSSKKRILISICRNKINTRKKSIIKTFIKKIRIAVKTQNNKQLALKYFTVLQSFLDRFSLKSKRVIHKNKSSRYKSNLMKLINGM